jgi:hypothetical protein
LKGGWKEFLFQNFFVIEKQRWLEVVSNFFKKHIGRCEMKKLLMLFLILVAVVFVTAPDVQASAIAPQQVEVKITTPATETVAAVTEGTNTLATTSMANVTTETSVAVQNEYNKSATMQVEGMYVVGSTKFKDVDFSATLTLTKRPDIEVNQTILPTKAIMAEMEVNSAARINI